MKKIVPESQFILYPFCQLPQLIGIIQEKAKKKLRFVVDEQGQAWFAEEGSPSKTTPAHYQMLSSNARHTRCITAGNIRFSNDYRAIEKVSNKSGDFRPSFDSLKWFLAILVANPIATTWLNTQIELIDSENKRHYALESVTLTSWFIQEFQTELSTLQHQPEACHAITYHGLASQPLITTAFLTSPASSSRSIPPTASSDSSRFHFLSATSSTPTLSRYNLKKSSRRLSLTDDAENGSSSRAAQPSLPTSRLDDECMMFGFSPT